MKHILITGAGSYVGSSLEAWLRQWPEEYLVDTLDMIGDGWKAHDFHGYDAVVHVAGIVHREDSKKDPGQAELYDRVNHRLAVETARKRIAGFAHTHTGPMPGTQVRTETVAVRQRQHAGSSRHTTVPDDHSAVMKGRVLEENIPQQLL